MQRESKPKSNSNLIIYHQLGEQKEPPVTISIGSSSHRISVVLFFICLCELMNSAFAQSVNTLNNPEQTNHNSAKYNNNVILYGIGIEFGLIFGALIVLSIIRLCRELVMPELLNQDQVIHLNQDQVQALLQVIDQGLNPNQNRAPADAHEGMDADAHEDALDAEDINADAISADGHNTALKNSEPEAVQLIRINTQTVITVADTSENVPTPKPESGLSSIHGFYARPDGVEYKVEDQRFADTSSPINDSEVGYVL